jgi:orotate phosphoribosyltransferase
MIFKENNMERKIAKDLLDIKAVFLKPNDPFTWASGIKSPIYCDNRLTLSYPKVRNDIESGLAKLVKEYFKDVECLMGTSTAGIAHAALVADILDLPMGYVRGGAKSHGRNNQIEGVVKEGMKVVVVEDLISTGGSSLEVVDVLRQAGCEVLGMVAIFTYGLPNAKTNFEKANCKYVTLSNYDTLIEVAKENNYIKDEDKSKLAAWKQDPSDHSWMSK